MFRKWLFRRFLGLPLWLWLTVTALLAVAFMVQPISAAPDEPKTSADPPACQVGQVVELTNSTIFWPDTSLTGKWSLVLDPKTGVTVQECRNEAVLIRVYGWVQGIYVEPGDLAGGWRGIALFDYAGRAFGLVGRGTKIQRYSWQPTPPGPSTAPSQAVPGLPPTQDYKWFLGFVEAWADPVDLGFAEPEPPTCPPCPTPEPTEPTGRKVKILEQCPFRLGFRWPSLEVPVRISTLEVGEEVTLYDARIEGGWACGPIGCTNRWAHGVRNNGQHGIFSLSCTNLVERRLQNVPR